MVGGKPSIALTFDCAWVAEANGMKILDFLKSRNIRTTFFISGPFIFKDIARGRAGGLNIASLKMVRTMVQDGHEFGNHTQNHPHNNATINWEKENTELLLGWNEIVAQAFKGETVPENAKMLPFWRAPYGEYDDRSLRQAANVGFPFHFGWNVDSLDSTGLPSCKVDASNPKCIDASRMTKRVVGFAENNNWKFNGMVVLAHLQNPYDWTENASGLETLVNKFRSNGVEFRRISEFFDRTLAPNIVFAPQAPLPAELTPENGEAKTNAGTWLKVSSAESNTLKDGTEKCFLPAGTLLAYSARSVRENHTVLNLKFADVSCPAFATQNVHVFNAHFNFVVK